jgi:excisionase family DNA binding protein
MVDRQDRLLTPREAAVVFRVDVKAVTKWANAGRIQGVRTPGGHWRFRESHLRELLNEFRSET